MGHRRAPRADSDLDDIWFYVASESGNMETADRVVKSITDRFYLLSQNPFLGRSRDGDLRPGLRSFPVGPYLIVYRIEGEDIAILYVFHAQRNIAAFFEQ